MKATTVVTLEEGKLGGLANVPGGVIATVTSSPVPRVLIYRLGRPRVVDLPAAGGLIPVHRVQPRADRHMAANYRARLHRILGESERGMALGRRRKKLAGA